MRLKHDKYKKFLIFGFAILLALPSCVLAAEQAETAKIITQITPAAIAKVETEKQKGEIFIDNYYEHSKVHQGTRRGSWEETTNLAGYKYGNLRSYFSVSQLRRFDDRNYTANFGAYYTMPNSYCHFETGFGWDTSYIYRTQNLAEYAHRLYKGLYWQLGYNYRTYGSGNSQLIYPGLYYYFGNSYLALEYGRSMIDGRGGGNMGSLKSNIAINNRLNWWSGAAYGQRLYDIYELPASEQYGCIIFSGFTYKVTENISLRAGYTYGKEKPKFFKRGYMLDLALKF